MQSNYGVQLWLVVSSQIPRVRRRPTDQSDGPLFGEHVLTLRFLMERVREELLVFRRTGPLSTY